jgi:hypothetical protein
LAGIWSTWWSKLYEVSPQGKDKKPRLLQYMKQKERNNNAITHSSVRHEEPEQGDRAYMAQICTPLSPVHSLSGRECKTLNDRRQSVKASSQPWRRTACRLQKAVHPNAVGGVADFRGEHLPWHRSPELSRRCRRVLELLLAWLDPPSWQRH